MEDARQEKLMAIDENLGGVARCERFVDNSSMTSWGYNSRYLLTHHRHVCYCDGRMSTAAAATTDMAALHFTFSELESWILNRFVLLYVVRFNISIEYYICYLLKREKMRLALGNLCDFWGDDLSFGDSSALHLQLASRKFS